MRCLRVSTPDRRCAGRLGSASHRLRRRRRKQGQRSQRSVPADLDRHGHRQNQHASGSEQTIGGARVISGVRRGQWPGRALLQGELPGWRGPVLGLLRHRETVRCKRHRGLQRNTGFDRPPLPHHERLSAAYARFLSVLQGMPEKAGCVARAEQLHTFPRSAAIIGEPPSTRRPAHGACGSFADPFDSYWVSVSNQHTTRTTALALMHASFWRTAKTHSTVGTGFVISGFPGWQCSSATGTGLCTKGRQAAQWGIQNMIRWAHPSR